MGQFMKVDLKKVRNMELDFISLEKMVKELNIFGKMVNISNGLSIECFLIYLNHFLFF